MTQVEHHAADPARRCLLRGMTGEAHPSIRRCNCGHLEVEHQSSGSGWPHPVRHGVCLSAGCDCREFEQVDMKQAA